MPGLHKRWVVGLLLAAMLLAGWAGPQLTARAQETPPPAAVALPRTITVVGEGSVSLEPDIATLQVGVDIAGDSAKAASSEVKSTIDAILAALKAQDVAQEDIQTSNYSIYVERPTDPKTGMPGETITYRANNFLTVTVRDLTKVGDLLEAAIDAGANNIYGVNFGLEDSDAALADARKLAAANARAKAAELAGLHGVTLGNVVSVSEVIENGMYTSAASLKAMAAGSGGGPGIQPGELEIGAQLQVVYAIAGDASAVALTETMTSTLAAGAVVTPTVKAAETVTATLEAAEVMTPTLAAGAVVTPTVKAAETVTATLTVSSTATISSSVTMSHTMGGVQTITQVQQIVTPGGGSGKTVITGDDKWLRPFVETWFRTSYGATGVDTEVLLGSMPADLGFKLPLPPRTQVVGSVVQQDQLGTSVYLNVPLSAEETQAFFAEQLPAVGLVPNVPFEDTSVFGTPSGAGQLNVYCAEDKETVIYTTVSPTEDDQQSSASLQITRQNYGPCSDGGSPVATSMAQELLPKLKSPAGAQMDGSGGGGSSDRDAYASATFTSDLDAAALNAQYASQLKAAGWKLIKQAEADGVAWSSWELQDKQGKPWAGMLTVSERPARANGFNVELRVERAQ